MSAPIAAAMSAARADGEMFDPPNSLKMKAKDKMSADIIAKKLDMELQVAREQAGGRKAAPRFLPDLHPVAADAGTGKPAASWPADLIKLGNLTRAIGIAARSPAAITRRLEWCASILAAVEGLKLEVDRNASMHLLGHAALSLHQLICPEKSPADQLNEIDATVAIIRARSQATALAS